MKIAVDNKLHVSLFGTAAPKTDEVRYYYQVVGYSCLILVIQGKDYVEAQGKTGIALFNFDSIRGDLVCNIFPKAPARWAKEENLVQCSVRFVPPGGLPSDETYLLSEAIKKHLGNEC